MRRILSIVIGTLLFCCLSAFAVAQSRRAMSPSDILQVANVSDSQISPNGEWVVYSVSSVDGDRASSRLWLARAGATRSSQPMPRSESRTPRNPPTLLLASDWNASSPRWSPDSSSIAFFANREGVNGIWVVSLTRREPRFVAAVQSTNFFITYAGESLSWAPDSRRIAYISATDESNPDDGAKPDDPRVIDRIQYKSRTAFSDNRRTHVFVVDVTKPEPRQLTFGSFYDHAISFSPRGDEVVFLSNREPNPDANNNSDIFAVDLGGQVRQITQTRGCEYEPVWSPDGKWIAYTATKREVTTIDSISEDTHVWVTVASGSERRELATELDRRARSPRWSRDSNRLFFLAGDQGNTTIFTVAVDGGKVNRLSIFTLRGEVGAAFDMSSSFNVESLSQLVPAKLFQISSFSLAQQALVEARQGIESNYRFPIALTLGGPDQPAELWLGLGSSTPLRRLSAHNDGFKRSVELVQPEEVRFRSFDGTSIQGWLLKPLGWRADREFPLILSIHGGPHGMFGAAFNSTFQVYAARGYAVLYINPRGSSGYGQKFSDGTLNEWGGGDYKDLMAGVDEAVRKHSWIDSDRLGVTGGSYGGFMTNWIITQTPRFKAAVASASVSNLISFYSTSLYQDLIHAEFGSFPWDNYEQLWQWSPLRYVRQAQTPTLFIHGELDNDVHITQAEEMYMGLKRRGVDTVLVRYPREGHGLREPRHRVDALERTIAWFDRYLK